MKVPRTLPKVYQAKPYPNRFDLQKDIDDGCSLQSVDAGSRLLHYEFLVVACLYQVIARGVFTYTYVV
jgi:hypothetical protein